MLLLLLLCLRGLSKLALRGFTSAVLLFRLLVVGLAVACKELRRNVVVLVGVAIEWR